MLQRILALILLTPIALAQIGEIRPDLSYTGNNDRFDLSEMVNAQNRMNRDTPLVDDDQDEDVAPDADYRRDLQDEDTDESKTKDPSHAFLTRREEPDFAYDSDNLPTIGRAGNDDDMLDSEFQENLNKFKMNIPRPSRRNSPDEDHKHEDDVLMQNVVPIVLTVDGYLKAPLQEITKLDASQGKRSSI